MIKTEILFKTTAEIMNQARKISNFILVGYLLFSFTANAQSTVNEITMTTIIERSKLWNSSFNSRDSSTFYTLFDSLAVLSSGGGRWIGNEECKRLCRGLYQKRPDITWINKLSKVEVFDQWKIAYETGDWKETWTEGNDKEKSQITGKYWIMWRYENKNWIIISGIFTPLSCKG